MNHSGRFLSDRRRAYILCSGHYVLSADLASSATTGSKLFWPPRSSVTPPRVTLNNLQVRDLLNSTAVYVYPHVVVVVVHIYIRIIYRAGEKRPSSAAITGRLAHNGITAPPRAWTPSPRSGRSGLCGKTTRKRRSDGVLCVVQSTCEETNNTPTKTMIESDITLLRRIWGARGRR